MAFQFKQDESVRKGIRRIVRRQLKGALDDLQSPDNRDEAVHAARKRFKRIRAVLRLVRKQLGNKLYQRENVCFRDAARPLTEVRDAFVLVQALDRLTDHFAGQITAGAFNRVHEALVAHQQAVRTRVLDEEQALQGVAKAVEEARDRLGGWPVRHCDWAALRTGLKQIYRAGRKALKTVRSEPSVENLHEWRKQAKYLWHHVQLLEPAWPPILKELGDQIHTLTELLGDDHDLAVLQGMVTNGLEIPDASSVLPALLALIDRRRQELEQEAFDLGQRIYNDRPKDFTNRIKGYWKTWRAVPQAESTVPRR